MGGSLTLQCKRMERRMYFKSSLLMISLALSACDTSPPPSERVVYVPITNPNAGIYAGGSGGQQISPMVQQMYQEDNTRAIVNAINRKGY